MKSQKFTHCPNPACSNHDERVAKAGHWYRPHGWYTCPSNQQQQIRRYRCLACGKTFSETYFSRLWHLHRRDIDDVELLFEWCCGSDIVSLAKYFNCSPKTITHRLERMQELAAEKELVIGL